MNAEFEAVDWDDVRGCIFATEQEFACSEGESQHYYDLAAALDAFLVSYRKESDDQSRRPCV